LCHTSIDRSTTKGKGDWIVERAHRYGGKVIATVVSEKHARTAESIGADCLMVTGHEAAGTEQFRFDSNTLN